jgi:hypothetical protein
MADNAGCDYGHQTRKMSSMLCWGAGVAFAVLGLSFGISAASSGASRAETAVYVIKNDARLDQCERRVQESEKALARIDERLKALADGQARIEASLARTTARTGAPARP